MTQDVPSSLKIWCDGSAKIRPCGRVMDIGFAAIAVFRGDIVGQISGHAVVDAKTGLREAECLALRNGGTLAKNLTQKLNISRVILFTDSREAALAKNAKTMIWDFRLGVKVSIAKIVKADQNPYHVMADALAGNMRICGTQMLMATVKAEEPA